MPTIPKPKSRRQTLGSVDVLKNNVARNRRQSVDPSMGAPPKPRIPRGRKSMIPNMGRENLVPPTPPPAAATKRVQSKSTGRRRSTMGEGRRQSIIPPSTPAAKTDPRPTSDKEYQHQCIKRLYKFLLDSSYEYPVSMKSLSKPSKKDFDNIVTFMLRLIDPSFQDGSMNPMKIEDEISMNFRAMGYPFPLSKTTLVAAGSPHTVSSLLATLTWLMERIQLLGLCQAPNDDNFTELSSIDELETKTDRTFMKYLANAYSTGFLKDDEGMIEQLQNALADSFTNDDRVIEAEIEKGNDISADYLERIANIEAGEQDLEGYIKKRDGYTTDLEQFKDLIQQMDEHVETLLQKKKDRIRELAETNQKLERVNQHVSTLKNTISNQALSIDDVQKLQGELKGIEEAIDRACGAKEERRGLFRDSAAEVAKLLDDLDTFVVEYNAKANEISLVPSISHSDIHPKATVDKDAMLESDLSKLLGVQLVPKVQDALTMCKNDVSHILADSKAAYQEALDKVERSEECFTEALEKLKIIEEKMDKCDETAEAEREAQDAKIAVRHRDSEAMESRVASLRDPVALEEKLTELEQRQSELEAQAKSLLQDNLRKKREVREEIEKALESIQLYDAFCTEKVQEVQRYRQDKQKSFKKLALPKEMAD